MKELSIFKFSLTVLIVLLFEISSSLIRNKKIDKKVIFLRTAYLSLLLCITIIGRGEKKIEFSFEALFTTYRNVVLGVKYAEYDIINNILLFIPAGALFEDTTFGKMTLKIFLLSLTLEMCQLLLKCGLFEMCDLIDNTLGGIIGLLITRYVCPFFSANNKDSR